MAHELHEEVMELLQERWEKDRIHYKKFRKKTKEGMRSSQIAAVVELLIDMGLITPAKVATCKMNMKNKEE
jgi:RNA polymerase-interacting CarD/CdnL/TRCF family regulator